MAKRLPVGLPRATIGYVLLGVGVWWLWYTGGVLILLGVTLLAAGFAQGRDDRNRRDQRKARESGTARRPYHG